MDPTKKHNNPSPEVSATPISKLFFCWVLPFFKYGYQNNLEVKDLYNCTEVDLSEPLGNKLEKYWEQEVITAKKLNKKPSLVAVIRRTFIKNYTLPGVLLFLQCVVIRMLQPIVLAYFIQYFGEAARFCSPGKGWLLGFGVVILAFLNVLLMHHSNLSTQRIGMQCRIACCSLVYRKLLRMSKNSLGQITIGQVVNLLSNDVNRFDMAATFLHFIWIMPVQMIIAASIMYGYIGVAAASGLLAMTLQAVLLQGYLAKLQGTLRFAIALRTDNRIKLMNEITSGIQVIKMYAWEKPFAKLVALVREYEIKMVAKTSYIKGFSSALMVFTERASLYLSLITYVLIGNSLTSGIVFSMAQLFNTVQLYMCILFPLGISSYAEAKTSISRLEDFLMKEENETIDSVSINNQQGLIKLSCVHASWVPNPIVDTLIDLNLEVKPGMLCCIVGHVGSGKSSILQLLLKELPLTAGKMLVEGSICYASQEPWLFVSNIRSNILFGQQYDKKRYHDVVDVCELQRDFQELPFGDKTPVGERGVSLSGGQRARINLARAVYRESDIYLLDDPLSAVDTHVGKQLFEKCIMNYLQDKTRILVTHQLQFLKHADTIIIIDNGKITKIGAYNELSEAELLSLQQEPTDENIVKEVKVARERLKSISSVTTSGGDGEEGNEPAETQELMERGAMSNSVYKDYYKAGASIAVLIFLFCLLIIAQAASNACDLWVTHWTKQGPIQDVLGNETGNFNCSMGMVILPQINDTKENETSPTNSIFVYVKSTPIPIFDNNSVINETSIENVTTVPTFLWNHTIFHNFSHFAEAANLNNTTTPVLSKYHYIMIYTLFILLAIILTTARSLLFFKICMNASIRLHNIMFENIVQATMRFFDTNPSGRILNRFSKDMGAIDEMLPYATLQALQVFLVASGILVMVFIFTPLMIIPAFILGCIFWWFRIVFMKGAQDVKRLEGITRAPVFSHVSATLNGLCTIRSSKAQSMVTKEFDTLQDLHSSSWFLYIASYETFGFYLDMISLVFLVVVTFQFLIFDNGSTLSGNVGLVVSQSLIIVGMLQYGVRQTADVASNMTSVERVLQYTKLEKEGPFESLPSNKPPSSWPHSGQILFKNVYLRYVADEEPVLKNLNIKIEAGQKVGVVGRTGAGKSSLISALFRLTSIDGTIEIDDIDTSTVGLNDLRSNISIIPQEPVLFSASVRYNLDPFNKCDDKSLWKALECVELKDVVESLDQNVSEGGSNFSAGQRQLVCLARAIVRSNKVLVMDEATANVDPQTDALIQSSIRTTFQNCTVITVAHRLNTIMDSDKVLVMDAGQVVEFAHPHELLQNKDGFFCKMLQQTGQAMEFKLRKIAADDFNSKCNMNANN